MTDDKPKKKSKEKAKDKDKAAVQTQSFQQAQHARVGELLRRAREEKGLEIEDISAAINIRSVQLRAIEEGNLDALPGMIYATGFVKSYANFLKLDGVDVVKTFKEEQGAAANVRPDLQFPEPIKENKTPNTMTAVIAALGAAVLLILWTLFSGGGSKDEETVQAIAPPPAAEGSVAVITETAVVESAASDLVDATGAMVPAEATVPPAEGAAGTAETSATDMTAATSAESADAAPSSSEGVIAVKPGRGRVTIEANSPVWVQISDGNDQVVFKKVLHPGEKYHVPDQKGMSLVTSNAGGLDLYVDGAKVQPVGKPGEILRGVDLSPHALKQRRVRIKN